MGFLIIVFNDARSEAPLIVCYQGIFHKITTVSKIKWKKHNFLFGTVQLKMHYIWVRIT